MDENEGMPEIGKYVMAAVTLHEVYSNFVDVGFTEDQALRLTIAYLQTSITGSAQ